MPKHHSAPLPQPTTTTDEIKKFVAEATTFNAISQYAHFLAGEFIVFHVGLWFGVQPAIWAAVVLGLVTFVKEAWFDVEYESAETAGSGALDWTTWNLGSLLALVELFLRR